MPLPDLVIAGAPKCGTSSLFNWLADHPDICGSVPKETHFLLDRGHPLLDPGRNVHDHGLAAYEHYFTHCGNEPDAGRFLEASTHYIYQETAPRILSQLPHRPSIVMLLRKPSERVYSSYQYTRHNLGVLHGTVDFETYLTAAERPTEELTKERWGGKTGIWRNDVRYSRYVEYLRTWARYFPPERLHVLQFEAMRKNPLQFVRHLCILLNIDPDFYETYDFPASNRTYTVKWRGLHRLARRLGPRVPRHRLGIIARRAYTKVATSGARPSRTDADLRTLRALEHEFAPWNRQLAEEFGIDLGLWQ